MSAAPVVRPVREDDLEAVLVQAVALVLESAPGDVVMRVPGSAFVLLRALAAAGFQLGDVALFMSSGSFGRPELRLPSGPYLF